MNRVKKLLATVIMGLLLVALPQMNAMAAGTDNARENAYAGGRYVVNLSTNWAGARFPFTPTITGWYRFYSDGRTSGDPYFMMSSSSYPGTVSNALASQGCQNDTARSYSLTYSDDTNGSNDFSAEYFCYAGSTYYLFATKYRNEQTNFYLNVSQPSYGYITLNRNGGSGGASGFYTSTKSDMAWMNSNSTSGITAISPPTRSGYTFTGYYNTSATTGGTQYVAANGALVNGVGTQNGTLYARWQQNVFILTFNNQGVSNTSQAVASGGSIPASVTSPVRVGYKFNGYYSSASGGTQYYNQSGGRITNLTMTNNNTLYAHWSPQVCAITYQGMEGAAISGQPVNHTYNTATHVADPTKADYTFMGWSVNGGSTMTKGLTLGATSYTGNITLKANWVQKTGTSVENPDGIITSDNLSQLDLEKIFNNPVSEAEKGVTANELNGSSGIHLKLQVNNISGTIEGENEIKAQTNGEVVKFFDVKVVKEVTDATGAKHSTNLTEVPDTIEIRIPLSGDLVGKSSYQVLRYHTYSEIKNGVTANNGETHRLDEGTGVGEYYTVEGNTLIIHTRMFSTYAIAAGETSLNLTPPTDGGTGDGAGMDVQGKISQKGLEAVYKIDVSWGPMVFEYTTAREWDPYNHTYQGASYSWSQKSFEEGNNTITLANHSNADINIDFTFAKEKEQLEGVDVLFKAVNADTALSTTHYFLEKVPTEGAEAPKTKSYLWLSGTPATMPGGTPQPGESSALTKVGVITTTISTVQGSTLTPKTP